MSQAVSRSACVTNYKARSINRFFADSPSLPPGCGNGGAPRGRYQANDTIQSVDPCNYPGSSSSPERVLHFPELMESDSDLAMEL